MRILTTSARIRSVISSARTEKDIEQALRAHRIPYSYSTDGGVLHIRVPVRSGAVRIIRTCSRSAPFQVRQAMPVPDLYPVPIPVLHPEY